ncbi:Non-functional NADPH-dependent codeinone reductase 2-like [Asimina triloba]
MKLKVRKSSLECTGQKGNMGISIAEAVTQISSGGEQSMPLIALGTAAYPFTASEAMKSAILYAIQLGYRHFDSAALYQS